MKNKKMILTWSGLLVLYIFIVSLLFSIFNYFQIIKEGTMNIISLILMIIFFSLIGFNFGIKANKKGYLEGIKVGSSLIILFIVINLLFGKGVFRFEQLIYYVVLVLSSTLGSMLGISKKG